MVEETPQYPFTPQYPLEEEDEEIDGGRALLILGVIIVLLVIAGLGIWYYVANKTDDEETETPPVAVETPIDNYITARDGGTVVYKDPQGETVKIVIPAGALSKDTKIEVEWVSTGEVTDLYHLKPDGTTFKKPVTVIIPYNKLPSDITLEYWMKSSLKKKVLNFTIDREAKTLEARVNGF